MVEKVGHGDGPGRRRLQGHRGDHERRRATCRRFEVKAITGGTDALGEVTVILEEDGRTVRGHGADTDIIVASAKAYIKALNKLAVRKK
ncbi:MAG: hypothetical protein MZV70_44995 [Desulfobacterales bacterium]|nr:hypothetical protein [Desulfobacterales bacterium]